MFKALRYLARSGCPGRFLPNDFPPFYVVCQPMKREERAQVLEARVQDLRECLRLAVERKPPPGAVMLAARTLQSTPESGARAGDDGGKRRKGSKVHLAVDTMGHYLALLVTPANEDDRAQGAELCEQLQAAPGETRLSWRLWSKATPENALRRRRRHTQSVSKWSNCQKPNVASCCYPDVGSSSGRLAGLLVFAVLLGIMNGSLPL